MNISIEEQERLTDKMCDLKVEIVLLREKLRQAEEEQRRTTSECERLKEELRSERNRAGKNVNPWMKDGYIVISLAKLKRFLAGIKDTKLAGFIACLLQKILPKETDASVLKLIVDAVPEDTPPDIVVNAEGDVRVEGNYYNLQDNDLVNIQNS